MSSAPGNPQDVFRSALPVGTSLIVIFVPSQDRDGQPIPQDYWVDEVLTTLGRLFRGATAYPRGRGVWRDDERGGILLTEEPVIVFSYAAEGSLTADALADLYRTLSRMGAGPSRVKAVFSLTANTRARPTIKLRDPC